MHSVDDCCITAKADHTVSIPQNIPHLLGNSWKDPSWKSWKRLARRSPNFPVFSPWVDEVPTGCDYLMLFISTIYLFRFLWNRMQLLPKVGQRHISGHASAIKNVMAVCLQHGKKYVCMSVGRTRQVAWLSYQLTQATFACDFFQSWVMGSCRGKNPADLQWFTMDHCRSVCNRLRSRKLDRRCAMGAGKIAPEQQCSKSCHVDHVILCWPWLLYRWIQQCRSSIVEDVMLHAPITFLGDPLRRHLLTDVAAGRGQASRPWKSNLGAFGKQQEYTMCNLRPSLVLC